MQVLQKLMSNCLNCNVRGRRQRTSEVIDFYLLESGELTVFCFVLFFHSACRGFVWTYDVIILINAIFIALDEESPYISYAEWVFLALYIIEILLKVYTYEPRAFFGKNQFWNW